MDKDFRELDKKCHMKLVNLERRISENNNAMYESLDVRDNRFSERMKKMFFDHEKFVSSTEIRLKDINHKIEVEVRFLKLIIYKRSVRDAMPGFAILRKTYSSSNASRMRLLAHLNPSFSHPLWRSRSA